MRREVGLRLVTALSSTLVGWTIEQVMQRTTPYRLPRAWRLRTRLLLALALTAGWAWAQEHPMDLPGDDA
jgi:hypothetical protein